MFMPTITMAGSKQSNNKEVFRVWEMLDANDRAHRAYKRVLARPTMLEVAKNVICLLLWLETAMGIKVLQEVSVMETSRDPKLSLLIKEADGLYSYLLDGHEDALPEALVCNIPTIVSLCGDGGGGSRLVDFRFFKFHKELVARGVVMIRDTVATLVFNEDLHAMLCHFEDSLESSSVTHRPATPAPELMEMFIPVLMTLPEDSRMVFLAFSSVLTKGGDLCRHRISSEDIINQFERVFGFPGYIEHVEIEQPCAGQDSKHGIILFKSPENMKEAMFEETSSFFRIKSHDVWMQCYISPF